MRRFLLGQARLPEGWASDVLVEVDAAGLIAAVTPDAAAGADTTRLDGPVFPGIANLHSHAFQRAMAGLAEVAGPVGDNFWTWRETMYRFALKLAPEDVEAVAAQLYAEMLCRGYTAVAEFHYLHHQPDGQAYDDPAELSWRILAAAESSGIALTHLPVLYAAGGFGNKPAGERQRRFLHNLDRYSALLERLHPRFQGRADRHLGIAPHSLRAVPPDLLRHALALTDATMPVHIHIAEQTGEVEECVSHTGARPVEWLLNNAEVDARWCLVHATHMTEAETARLAASGAIAGLCPTTEANLGDGLFPAPEFLQAGGRFGIGSDSHISIDPAEELRWLEYGQRLTRRGRNLLSQGPGHSTGQRLLDGALAGGAQALGQQMGAIAVGKRADFVLLDPAATILAGLRPEQMQDAWIFSGQPSPVRDVFVGGNRVVADGRHLRGTEIAARYRATMQRLLSD